MDASGSSNRSEFLLQTLALAYNLSGRELPMEECEELGFFNLSSPELFQEFNISCIGHAPTLTTSVLWKATFLMLMAGLTIVSNGWMMINIQKTQRQRSSHLYTLVFHLAMADIFVAVFCIFGEGFWFYTVEWVLGNVGCKMFKFKQMFSLYLSTFIMVLIAIDHFISVKYPLKAMARGKCLRLIGTCWIASAVLSIPQAIIFHLEKGPFQEPFFQCVTHNFYTADWQEQLYAAITSIIMFVIPLIILVYTYLMTFWTLHRNEEFRDPSNSNALIDPRRRKIIRGAKMKSLRISVAITLTFLACWTPYYVLMIVSIFIHKTANEELKAEIFFFGMSTSLFNPLIYGLYHVRRPKKKKIERGASSKKTLLTTLSVREIKSSVKDHRQNGVHPNSQTKNGESTRNPSSPAQNNNSGKRRNGEENLPDVADDAIEAGHSIV